jgi:hypothetical protein
MEWFGELVRLIILALLALTVGASCSGNSEPSMPRIYTEQPGVYGENRVLGEYIVTIDESGDEARIREFFEAYSVKKVKDLGRGRFLIKLEQDPGPEVIKRKGLESPFVKRVQPNYIYRPNDAREKLLNSDSDAATQDRLIQAE